MVVGLRTRKRCKWKVVQLTVAVWIISVVLILYNLEDVEQTGVRELGHARRNHSLDSCPNMTFNGTFKENLRKLSNLVFEDSLPWIHALNTTKKSRAPTSLPVFVTAADQAFFVRSQGLVKSIHDKLAPVYKELKLIYFDLGLSESQRNIMQENCKCELRRLPTYKLPTHAQDNTIYAFKPIIIYLMYREFGHVWWLDASARIVQSDIMFPLKYLKENGILFFTFGPGANVAVHTDERTFNYFREDPCLYKDWGEVDASSIAFRRSPANDVILRLWLSCALDRKCIAPDNVTKYCEERNPKFIKTHAIGQCHRFDQSALSIILRRLYHKQNDYPLVEIPFRMVQIRRKEGIQYFYDAKQIARELSKNRKFVH